MTTWQNFLGIPLTPLNYYFLSRAISFIMNDSELLAVLVLVIHAYNCLRVRHRLTRSALLPPSLSPWKKLLWHGDDLSFLHVTGFSRPAFFGLVDLLYPREECARKKKGRPPLLDRRDQLGLLLLFLSSKMHYKHICMIFGVIPTTASRTINHMLHLVARRLVRNEHARIKFPDEEEMQLFAEMVRRREPLVDNVIGFVDGVSIPIQCSDDENEQTAHYNGYYHDTMVNNVFAFAPTGKIIHACINFPGSWHDSSVCFSLIKKVIDEVDGFALCVDQGFPKSGLLYDKLVGPLSRRAKAALAPIIRDYLIRKHEIYISLRQASEWGMRALQGSFCRLKSRLTSNKRKRHLIILCIVLLHNYRTEFVGLNQIATVFNEEYEQCINLSGYDRIAKFFEN